MHKMFFLIKQFRDGFSIVLNVALYPSDLVCQIQNGAVNDTIFEECVIHNDQIQVLASGQRNVLQIL